MTCLNPAPLAVLIYGEGEVQEITDDSFVKSILEMYNKSCDIHNDCGGIESMNAIWDHKHPDEDPNTSKSHQTEYETICDRISESIWNALSWIYGLDFDNGCRYVLLGTPYLREDGENAKWVVPVSKLPI